MAYDNIAWYKHLLYTYAKVIGVGVLRLEASTHKTFELGNLIAEILYSVGFTLESSDNYNVTEEDDDEVIIYNDTLIKDNLKLVHVYSECFNKSGWKINNGNKIHNNSIMVCYLIRKILKL